MISFMEKAQIISLFNSGISRRSIARIVGINRTTVNSYIKEYLLCQDRINKSEDKVEIALLQEEMFKTPKKKSTKRSCSKFKGKLKTRFEELIRNDKERNELITS